MVAIAGITELYVAYGPRSRLVGNYENVIVISDLRARISRRQRGNTRIAAAVARKDRAPGVPWGHVSRAVIAIEGRNERPNVRVTVRVSVDRHAETWRARRCRIARKTEAKCADAAERAAIDRAIVRIYAGI